MPPLQTTYNKKPAAGIPGRRATMEEWNTVTLTSTAVVRFGAPVEANGEGKCKEWDGTGDYLGIAEANQVNYQGAPGDAGYGQYAAYQEVPVNDMGNIWGLAGTGGCTYKGPVYWNAAGNYYTDTSSGNILVPNAEFDSAAAAGAVVRIKHRRVPA